MVQRERTSSSPRKRPVAPCPCCLALEPFNPAEAGPCRPEAGPSESGSGNFCRSSPRWLPPPLMWSPKVKSPSPKWPCPSGGPGERWFPLATFGVLATFGGLSTFWVVACAPPNILPVSPTMPEPWKRSTKVNHPSRADDFRSQRRPV